MRAINISTLCSMLILSGIVEVKCADGKLNEWGLFRFGMSTSKLITATGTSAQPQADQTLPEYSVLLIQNVVQLERTPMNVTARFYKDQAFDYTFASMSPVDQLVPSNQSSLSVEDKVRAWCPVVFSRTLDMLATTYGKPDDILRPSELTMADNNSSKASSARWWFSDKSRLVVTTNQRNIAPAFCTLIIGIRSAYYDKPFAPELAPAKK